jgi:hypothetical protein
MSNSHHNERFALARAIPLAIRRAIARAIAPAYSKKLEDCGARSKRLDEKWKDLCARGARLARSRRTSAPGSRQRDTPGAFGRSWRPSLMRWRPRAPPLRPSSTRRRPSALPSRLSSTGSAATRGNRHDHLSQRWVCRHPPAQAPTPVARLPHVGLDVGLHGHRQ